MSLLSVFASWIGSRPLDKTEEPVWPPLPMELFSRHMVSIYALNTQDIGRLSQVSRLFHDSFSGEPFWRFIYPLDFKRPKRPEETYVQAYRREHLLRSNLLNQVYSYTIIGTNDLLPENEFLPLVSAVKGRVISGSFLHETKMWDLETKEESILGDGPSTFVDADQDEVFMGKSDGSIEVFDLKTGRLRFLQAHDGPVLSLALQPHRYFSSSGNTIKVWDRTTGQSRELTKHDEVIEWLIVEGDILLSADIVDRCILWDLKKLEPILDFKCKTVKSLFLSQGMLIMGETNGIITFYDIAREEFEAIQIHSNEDVIALLIVDDLLFSGAGHELSVTGLKTGMHLLTVQLPTPIISLAYSEGVLFVSDDKGTVHGLDYSAGDEQVFKEIVLQLRSGEKSKIREALDRYSRMPKHARKTIDETFKSIQFAQKYFIDPIDHELRARAIERHLVVRKEEKEAKK